MTTITYGFFIYISLTTIYEIYASDSPSVSSNLKPNCTLSNVIRSSEYAKKCSKLTYENKTLLPEFEIDQITPYLCTGIFETANKICEMNANISSINATTLNKEILKSQASTKDLKKFCSRLIDVISSISYKTKMNFTAHPNIVKLNKNLNESCEQRLCWIGEDQTIANPLCSVLLWENEIVAKIEIPITQQERNQSKPHTSSQVRVPKVPTPQVITSSGSSGQSTAREKTRENTNAQTHEELIQSDPSTSTTLKGKVSAKSTAPKVHEQTQGKVDDANKQIANSGPGETGLPKKPGNSANDAGNQDTHDTHEEIASELGTRAEDDRNAGNPVDHVETGDGDNTKAVFGSDGNNELKTQLEINAEDGKIGENPGNDVGTGNEDNIQPGIGLDGDNDSKNYDGGDNDAQGQENAVKIDSAPTTKKKISNSPDQTPSGPSSNGKAVADSNTEDKVPNDDRDEEDRVHKDHGLPYSGPPDPPQHFFAYFMAISFICLVCYVGYHKKHKIMGIIFEGRKSRGGRARRRPNTAGYRKLDCNLEEAVTSQCNSNATHVIY